ncbi:MAG: InlB B-repeat-containing protein [candidate division KSB1 bacterium]|nr:InlB B-repeat-containing protein [candidate division KSB1 bacterium]
MKHSKLFFVTLILILGIVGSVQASHFQPPSSNFQPMNIYIIQAAYHGMSLTAGDEVAVFDGSLCVGVAVLSEPPTASSPALLNAYKHDDGDAGFTGGNPMTFKMWDASRSQVYTLSSGEVQFYDPNTGSPISPVPFEGLGTAVVGLSGGVTDYMYLTTQTTTGGSTSPAPGTHPYHYTETVSISALPESGYEFDYWEGDVADTQSASTTITMTEDETVTAHFSCIGYTVTMGVTPAGTGATVPTVGDTNVCAGSEITIKATPISGYEFVQWYGTGIADSYSANTTATITADQSITAEFQPITADQYTLNMDVNNSTRGSTTPAAGSYSISRDSVVTITASANAGYRFVNWSGDVADPNSATTTVTMNSNKTIVANFEQEEYDLTLSSNPGAGGSTSPSAGTYTYDGGQIVSIAANPVDGYVFQGWSGAVEDPNAQSTTVVMNADKVVTANFAPSDHYLTLQVNEPAWGTTNPSPGTHAYGDNYVVSLFAVPASGYQFVGWQGDVADPNDPSTSTTMTSSKTITAYFQRQQVTLTIDDTPGGSTTPVAGGHTYNSGDVVSISATPASGYYFVQWNGDVADPNSANTTVIMDEDKTISATFAEMATYSVNISVMPNGSGTTVPAPGTHAIEQNTQINIEAISNAGYHFSRWEGSGIADPFDSTTTLQVDAAKNIIAHFQSNQTTQYTLTMDINQSGWGATQPSVGSHQFGEGDVVTVRAIPESGYRFANWSGAVTDPNSAQTTVLIDGDKTITANFEALDEYTISVLPPDQTDRGSTTPGPGNYTRFEGETFEITATANTDYEFVNWNNNSSLTNPTLSFQVNSNRSLKPYFQLSSTVELTMRMNNNSYGSVSPGIGKHTYTRNDVVNVEAFPNPGFSFTHWQGDVAHTNQAQTTVTMDASKLVKAYFDHLQYDLTLQASPSAGGDVNPYTGTKQYDSWSEVQIEAVPAPGYKFVGWTGDVTNSSSATTTVTVDQNKAVAANFSQINEYTLTLNASPSSGGTTQPSVGSHTYEKDETVTVRAFAAAGYQFSHWQGDVANPSSATTTINITADKQITAVFEADQPNEYQLTVQANPANGGTTTPQAGVYTYSAGTSVPLTAVSNAGYTFSSWSGGVDNPSSAQTHVVMNSNKTVTANFEAGQTTYTFTIDVYPEATGTTQPVRGQHQIVAGTTLTIIANPAQGYKFEFWTGDVEEPYNDTTRITIDADKGVIAHFREIEGTRRTLSIAANPTDGGTVIPAPGKHEYNSGAQVMVQALPWPGYQFTTWQGPVQQPDSSTTSITMNLDHSIAANFQQATGQVFLTMQINPEGGGLTGPAVGQHSFAVNEKVNITAVPTEGYEFSHWTGDVNAMDKSSTYIRMSSNKTVRAHFTTEQTSKTTLTLSHIPVNGGSTTPTAGTYTGDKDRVIPISAKAASGYEFIGWQGDVTDPTDSTTTVELDRHKSIVAVFRQKDIPTSILSLSVSPIDYGTTAPATGIHSYQVGEVVTITALPYEGYYFKKWIGEVANPNSPTTTIHMENNKSVTAVFEKGEAEQFTLEMIVNPSGAGVTAPAVGSHQYRQGETVNITTIPSPGFEFTGWSGGVAEAQKPTTAVEMTGNKLIIASFKAVQPTRHTLTIALNPDQGGITVPMAGTYTLKKDSVMTVKAVATAGYRFLEWKGDVTDTDTSVTQVLMNSDKNITARFIKDMYTLQIKASPYEGGSTTPVSGDTMVVSGETVVLEAKPKKGFKFAFWSGDIEDNLNPTTVALTEDMNIIANFVQQDENIQTPEIFGLSDAFRNDVLHFQIHNALSNLGHNLQFQFDWGDGNRSDWVELNSQSENNITKITSPNGNSGLPGTGNLLDYESGTRTSVTLTVKGGTYNPEKHAMLGADPATGTDAWDIFNQIVDCRGTIQPINEPNEPLQLTLSGLDPDKRYTLAFFSDRNNFGWDRASVVTLKGAEEFINNSSQGKDQFGQSLYTGARSGSVKLPSDNSQTGYVAQFRNIAGGNDGKVTLSIDFGGSMGHEYKGKLASALMVKELDQSGVPSFTAYNDLAWSEDFYKHKYLASGSYLIRVRARCKTHQDVLSEWSETHSVIVSGCLLSTRVAPEGSGYIQKMPDQPDYAYSTPITLLATPAENMVFDHWNDDPTDSLSTKVITLNNHKTITAHFTYPSAVEEKTVPTEFALEQNYPNPFNPTTEIRYALPGPEHVILDIYDLRGRHVKRLWDGRQTAGHHKLLWNATNNQGLKVATGLYFYRLKAGDYTDVKRMILLK